MIMIGVTCSKNEAAPLVFADGVDVAFIYAPIAGCEILLPLASPGVKAGSTGGAGERCRPQRLQHYSQFVGASRQLGAMHLLLLEA